jgi:hypothetical protein
MPVPNNPDSLPVVVTTLRTFACVSEKFGFGVARYVAGSIPVRGRRRYQPPCGARCHQLGEPLLFKNKGRIVGVVSRRDGTLGLLLLLSGIDRTWDRGR